MGLVHIPCSEPRKLLTLVHEPLPALELIELLRALQSSMGVLGDCSIFLFHSYWSELPCFFVCLVLASQLCRHLFFSSQSRRITGLTKGRLEEREETGLGPLRLYPPWQRICWLHSCSLPPPKS